MILHFNLAGTKGTNICGSAKVKCYEESEEKLYGADVIDGLTDSAAKKFRKNCQCLPMCTSIVYEAEIDRAKFDWQARVKSLNYSSEYLGYDKWMI